MPFGKFQGSLVSDLETWYLRWLVQGNELRNERIREAIVKELERRPATAESEPQPPPQRRPRKPRAGTWEPILRAWYRDLALEFHPDRGGSLEAMQVINRANERLRELVLHSPAPKTQSMNDE
jgi:hypothetical protein